MKEWSRGGVKVGDNELGWKRGGFVGLNEALRFYQRSVANSCDRAARGYDVGREGFAVLCRMLLIVFQRARGLDEEDWTSEA